MASISDFLNFPMFDNGPTVSEAWRDIYLTLQSGEEGKRHAGAVFQAISDLQKAVAAQTQDPAAIAKIVIDGIGAQKAEDVLIELGKLITAATTPQAPAA